MYIERKELVTTTKEETVELVRCDGMDCGWEDLQYGANIQTWFRVAHMNAADAMVYQPTLHFHSLDCLVKTMALGDHFLRSERTMSVPQ